MPESPFPAPAAYCFSLKCVPESRIISWKVTFPHLHWEPLSRLAFMKASLSWRRETSAPVAPRLGNGYSVTFSLAVCFRSSDTHLFIDKVRGYDIKLLRYLSVKYICDLMVGEQEGEVWHEVSAGHPLQVGGGHVFRGSWAQGWCKAVTRAHWVPGLEHPLPVSSHSPRCEGSYIPLMQGRNKPRGKSLAWGSPVSTQGATNVSCTLLPALPFLVD